MIDQPEKTLLDKSRDIVSHLKEMQQYSESNIEKLAGFWLLLDDELKQKEFAHRVEKLSSHQNTFQSTIESLISDYEMECNRMENESS